MKIFLLYSAFILMGLHLLTACRREIPEEWELRSRLELQSEVILDSVNELRIIDLETITSHLIPPRTHPSQLLTRPVVFRTNKKEQISRILFDLQHGDHPPDYRLFDMSVTRSGHGYGFLFLAEGRKWVYYFQAQKIDGDGAHNAFMQATEEAHSGWTSKRVWRCLQTLQQDGVWPVEPMK